MALSVAIIDSGGANIASLLFALERLGFVASLTTDADVIRDADRVILPGVGAAADAMQRLRDSRLLDVIRTLQQPVLGIDQCLPGVQRWIPMDEHGQRRRLPLRQCLSLG